MDSPEEGYTLQSRRACYEGSDQVVLSSETENEPVAQKAFDCNRAGDEALRYNSSIIRSTLHMPLENNQMYTMSDDELSDCQEVTMCPLGTRMLS